MKDPKQPFSSFTPLHVLEREMDRLENELRQMERYYAKENRKYCKQEETLRSIKVKAVAVKREQDKIAALLEHHRQEAGTLVPGGCDRGTLKATKPERTDGGD